MLNNLKSQAQDLEKKLAAATARGDAKAMQQLQRQINSVNALMRQMQSQTQGVAEVMARLDRATPKELKATLTMLRKQLDNIPRGSAVWRDHVRMIQRVQAELSRVNAEMAQSQSWVNRLRSGFDKWANVAMAAAASVAGIVAAVRMSVVKYADMEQEEANVRKYTGMTVEETRKMNEAFKQYDTRTARVELNKLAQEAGRLGKASRETVEEYVRAAYQINVALQDLGEGATLTMSKLTDIFGDEKRLGTEKALLSVGSTLNELSMSCSASANYIANWTSRLGGVGAQARLTVQQIMSYAAVLDSKNQPLEASATAVAQVITRLYQQSGKYAKVAGLEAKSFAKLLRDDVNSAFLLFLDTLNKSGGMDKLAPMFKDMGETGSRAVAALSTLANNVQEVKEKQILANKAFDEAISVTKEFNIQNNTVQAGLEKAKKNFTEVAIALGERLQPVVRFTITSTSALVKVLMLLVDFAINYRREIIVTASAVTAYSVAVKAAAIATKAKAAASVTARMALAAWRSMVLLSSAATALMTGNVVKASAAMKLFRSSIAFSGVGLAAAAAVAAISVAVIKLTEKLNDFEAKVQKVVRSSKQWTVESVKERIALDRLFGTLESAKKGTEAYEKARQSLISQYGQYLGGLVNEQGEIINLASAYNVLTKAIARMARQKALANATQQVEDEYVRQSADDLKLLETSLKSYGATDKQVATVMAAAAESVSTGTAVSGTAANIVKSLSTANPTLDNKKGKQLNAAQILAAKWGISFANVDSPEVILSRVMDNYRVKSKEVARINAIGKAEQGKYTQQQLEDYLSSLDKTIAVGGGRVSVPEEFLPERKYTNVIPLVVAGGKENEYQADQKKRLAEEQNSGRYLTTEQAVAAKEAVMVELRVSGFMPIAKSSSENPEFTVTDNDDADSGLTEAEKEQAAKEAKAAAIKAKKEFKAELDAVKADMLNREAELIALRSVGEIDYLSLMKQRRENEISYLNKSLEVYERYGIADDDDAANLRRKKAEKEAEYADKILLLSRETLEAQYKDKELSLTREFELLETPSFQRRRQLEEELFELKVAKLNDLMALYDKGSKEYADLQKQLVDADNEYIFNRRKKLAEKVRELSREYDKLSAEDKFKAESDVMSYLVKQGEISQVQFDTWLSKAKDNYKKQLPGNTDLSAVQKAQKEFDKEKKLLDDALSAGMIDSKEYEKRLAVLKSNLSAALIEPAKECGAEWSKQFMSMFDAWQRFADAVKSGNGDMCSALSGAVSMTAALIASVSQSVTELTSANMQIQIDSITKRYNREIELAQGNKYLTARLEQEKADEIAAMKSEASEKQFKMQLFATLAQTAANAVAAYGAALQVGGMAGLILAPIAAGLAVAQGAVQIAVLEKQKQAAAASGYRKGGFTPSGNPDDIVGVVHAGEWVAPADLVNDPVARPLINALEWARANNSMAALPMGVASDVASAQLAFARLGLQGRTAEHGTSVMWSSERENTGTARLMKVLDRLSDRLDEPFLTVNTVSGKHGIKQAEDKYNRIISNKSRYKNRNSA